MRIASRSLARLAAGLAGLALAAAATAQPYPNKPVKLVVPYAPGGPTDIVARVVGQKLSEITGQTFFIENRPGAGGNLGADAVARSSPDGYQLLVATTAHAINPSLFKTMNYQLLKDFTPVSQLTSGPLVIVVPPTSKATNVAELLALAKTKPGGLNFASSGNGQSTHLAAELFSTTAGIKMSHVPYKGSAPALADVVAGQVDVMFDTMLSAMPLVKQGKLKALAVTSAKRSSAAPDLPTVAESGLRGYEVIAWNGLFAPARTPKESVARLNEALRKVLEMPDVRERFEAQGFSAAYSRPEVFGGFAKAEVDKWAKAVKQSGATLE